MLDTTQPNLLPTFSEVHSTLTAFSPRGNVKGTKLSVCALFHCTLPSCSKATAKEGPKARARTLVKGRGRGMVVAAAEVEEEEEEEGRPCSHLVSPQT